MGADMWAAEILLRMKEQQTYQDVELCLALPFEGYDSDWDDWHRKRMDFIRRYAEKVLILCETPSSESYKKRNYYMVEQAGYMILWDILLRHLWTGREHKHLLHYHHLSVCRHLTKRR